MMKHRDLLFLAIWTLVGCVSQPVDSVDVTHADVGGSADTALTTSARFDVFESERDGQYYFNLHAANHEVVLRSEGYLDRTSALAGALSVLDHGESARRYELLETNDGEWYFRLVAVNGEVIGVGESYTTKASARRGVAVATRSVASIVDRLAAGAGARAEVFVGADGLHYFNFHAENGEVMLTSEAYEAEASAYNGVYSVVANGVDPERYAIEQGRGGFHLNLFAANGEIIATSEAYKTFANAERARDSLVELLPTLTLL
jgi:uncharacterized protein YegP (UPF0339 family)